MEANEELKKFFERLSFEELTKLCASLSEEELEKADHDSVISGEYADKEEARIAGNIHRYASAFLKARWN